MGALGSHFSLLGRFKLITKLLKIRCDAGVETKCTADVIDEFKSPAEARRLMAEHGWKRMKGWHGKIWDVCPECSKILENKDESGSR